MPEIAEVKIVSDELTNLLVGKYLLSFQFSDHMVKSRSPRNSAKDSNTPSQAEASAEAQALFQVKSYLPQPIQRIYSHGKRIIIQCGPLYLISWLSMTGRWDLAANKHTKACLVAGLPLGQNNSRYCIQQVVYFSDVRGIGLLLARFGPEQLNDYINAKLGPDLLDSPPDWLQWQQRWRAYQVRHKKQEVCQALLEQSLYAGVGNYLKAEILYRCQIRPDRLIVNLSDQDLENLRGWTLHIIREAYVNGGTTLEDYITPSGKRGNYQNFLLIYGRSVDPLGHPVKTSTFKDQRTSHWCEICQL